MLLAVLGPRVATFAQVKCVFVGVVVEDVLRLCNEHKEAQKPLQAHDENVANKQSYQLLLVLKAHPPLWRHLQSVGLDGQSRAGLQDHVPRLRDAAGVVAA